jgi:two-component system sensor histidine kinase BaeS
MKSLFVNSFLAFVSAFFMLLVVVGLILFGGFQHALQAWEKEKKTKLEELILSIVENPQEVDTNLIPVDVPFFILNKEMQLVFSNRGIGFVSRLLSRSDIIYEPFKKNDEIIGYYYLGEIHFRDDAANKRFLDTLYIMLAGAFLLSLVIALLPAFFFSKSLAKPAKVISSGLDALTQRRLKSPIPEKGAAELAQIARSANTLNRQLTREHELRQQWAHDIAHDLRTPISALKAQLEGMYDGVLDLTTSRIEKNLKEIYRIEKLVNDLEELMRLEQPEMQIHKNRISTASFLEIIQTRFQNSLLEKSIHWECLSHVPYLWIDEDLMLRAISNIVSNAIRHTEVSGHINFVIQPIPKEEYIRISIFNSGVPISENETKRVFDRLYRGEYARQTPGSGLGLTIAQRITELHGGIISILGKSGMGTEVLISLPDNAPDQ